MEVPKAHQVHLVLVVVAEALVLVVLLVLAVLVEAPVRPVLAEVLVRTETSVGQRLSTNFQQRQTVIRLIQPMVT